jgi:hypothetical protein
MFWIAALGCTLLEHIPWLKTVREHRWTFAEVTGVESKSPAFSRNARVNLERHAQLHNALITQNYRTQPRTWDARAGGGNNLTSVTFLQGLFGAGAAQTPI